jgi:hypothetical protein
MTPSVPVSNLSATTQQVAESSEALHPIRIGAVAQQPVPDPLTTIYVGLSQQLSMDLRASCSCAGLMFAQIVSEQEKQIVIRVAALPRYFSAPLQTLSRHVRTLTISYEQFDQLLEWDRELAAKPTCDLRDLVTEHATESWRRGARARVLTKEAEATAVTVTPVVSEATTVSPASPEAPQAPKQKAERSHRQHLPAPNAGTYTEAVTVMIPTETIKVTYNTQGHHGRPLSEQLLLLRAALAAAEDTAKEGVLRRVLVLRDRLRPFVKLTPVYERGRTQNIVVGFSVRIDVLQEVA